MSPDRVSNPRPAAWSGLVGLASMAIAAAISAANDDSSATRESRGLVALYDFRAIDGELVKDQAGGKQPLHLKLTDAKAVRHSSDGLEVADQTLLQSERPAGQLSQAIKQSRGLTIEAWVRPAKTVAA